MSTLEARYRRLLQWYPRPWREQNGEVLIGTALDAAEAEGRTRPAAVEILQMALHGIAERATVRVALVTAVAALLCAFATQVVLITSIRIVAQWGAGWLPLALGALSGILQTLSLLALLRSTGRMRPGRLVPVMLTASAAWALAFLAAWSWSVGFDRADAGVADTAFSGAFTALLGAGWVLGAAVVASLVHELTLPLPGAAGYAAAGAAALVCPPVIGMIAAVPLVGALEPGARRRVRQDERRARRVAAVSRGRRVAGSGVCGVARSGDGHVAQPPRWPRRAGVRHTRCGVRRIRHGGQRAHSADRLDACDAARAGCGRHHRRPAAVHRRSATCRPAPDASPAHRGRWRAADHGGRLARG
jgi:hypothetical protein